MESRPGPGGCGKAPGCCAPGNGGPGGNGGPRLIIVPSGVTCSSAHFRPNLHPPLAKYLHGAGRVVDSTSCENGHVRPAWQVPCR